MTKAPLGTTARTGEKCPESGVWTSVSSPSTTAPIAKGNIDAPLQQTSGDLETHFLCVIATAVQMDSKWAAEK